MPAPDAVEIVLALTDALPRNAERRTEIVAVGMLATALISDTCQEDHPRLVEEFCSILRRSIVSELN